ncbi:MAG: hypothetical protein ABI808_12510 [Pseudonocardiales bacterium]
MASGLKRGIVGLFDQGFSGLSNVLMVLTVANGLSPTSFGSFALAYAILTFLLTLSRSFFGTQLTLSHERSVAREQAHAAFGAIVIVSPLIILVVLGVGLSVNGTNHVGVTAVVALAAPIVCIQDVLRYAAVAVERPAAALISDISWTVIMAAAVVGLVRLHGAAILALWLGAAVFALVVCVIFLGVAPGLRAGSRLLRDRHVVAQSVTIGAIAISGAGLLVSIATTRFLGPAALGSLRGASAMMGPLNVLFAFVSLNLTPTLARRARARDLDFCVKLAAVVTVGIIAWASVLLLLPSSIGTHLLGRTWTGTRTVLPWTSLEYISLGIAATSTLWLRVRHAARSLLIRSLTYAGAVMLFGISAAQLGASATAVAIAGSAAAAISAITGWSQVLSNSYHRGQHRAARNGRRTLISASRTTVR